MGLSEKNSLNNLNWQIIYQHMLIAERDGKTLAVTVASNNDGGFLAMAVETEGLLPKEIFDNHGHSVIGVAFHTIENAKKAGEKYARRWLRGAVDNTKCDCEEINSR